MPAVVSYTNVSLMLTIMPSLVSHTNLTSLQLAIFASNAEQEINGMLAKRYDMPPSSQNNMLETLATELALCKVLTQRVLTGAKSNDSDWPSAFCKAVDKLKDIASGKIALVDNNGDPLAASTGQIKIWSDKSAYLPTMTEDGEINQVDDPDKIDDIREDRELFGE